MLSRVVPVGAETVISLIRTTDLQDVAKPVFSVTPLNAIGKAGKRLRKEFVGPRNPIFRAIDNLQ